VQFVKMQGAGNDFAVIDGRGLNLDWPALAVQMTDRHFGVGGDGIIVALPSNVAGLRMRMFNPDGSEAEMCGNGLRCLAKYAIERGIATPKDETIHIETVAGVLSCRVWRDGEGRVERVKLGMGRPHLDPREIPVAVEQTPPVLKLPLQAGGDRYEVTCVSMGNPHAVWFAPRDLDLDAFPLTEVGPQIEHDPAFPRRVNFEVVVVDGPGKLRARVWERGAGITLACGTGACAVGVAARLNGLSGDRSEVTLPGGTLLIEWDGEGEVFLTGPAVEVFAGEWPDPMTTKVLR
jgi:diaminopimelate epimerase